MNPPRQPRPPLRWNDRASVTDVAGVAALLVIGVVGGLILAVSGSSPGARWCGAALVVAGVGLALAAVRYLRRPVERRD